MTSTNDDTTARALMERYGDEVGRRRSPVWIQWRSAAGTLDSEEVRSPEGLLGRTVAGVWHGAAVIGTGRFRLLDEAHEPPGVLKPGFSGGLTMACTVRRDGRVGWRMRLPDGTFYDRVPEEGFMLDILRRSVGLTTPPPPTSIAPLELAAWFAAVIGRSSEEHRRLDWCECLSLHPALTRVPETDLDESDLYLRSRSTTEEWDVMRRLVAAGLATGSTPPPELADWMDAGMFARWVLDGLPPLRALLTMVRPHLQAAAYRRLTHMARGLDDRVGAATHTSTVED